MCVPQNPNDISYVYSGYAPLSVRLAQLLARPGWRSIEEVLKMLPGPHFEERQQLPTGLQKKRKFGFVFLWFTGKYICLSEQGVRQTDIRAGRVQVCLSSPCPTAVLD